MSTALVGVALAMLAVAVIVLFAMFGELASRLELATPGPVEPRALDDARIGHKPLRWPGFDDRSDIPSALLVLSTVCKSCTDIARDIQDAPPLLENATLVISCPDAAAGEGFIRDYSLDMPPAHAVVDVGGDWSREELGIMTSPAFVALSDGTITAAYTVPTIATMRELGRRFAREGTDAWPSG